MRGYAHRARHRFLALGVVGLVMVAVAISHPTFAVAMGAVLLVVGGTAWLTRRPSPSRVVRPKEYVSLRRRRLLRQARAELRQLDQTAGWD